MTTRTKAIRLPNPLCRAKSPDFGTQPKTPPMTDESPVPIAEVISIGDELTTGQRLDTNSQWLSQRLRELGVRVLYHTTVGDELEANLLVFRQAIQRADIIVVTGGLGPTADDLTREALAITTGRELQRDETAEAHIRALFARRRREMPARNLVQAMFPKGATVIPNPHGTAPGIDLTVERPGRNPAHLFALPGVPAEMHEMWEQTVAAAVLDRQGNTRRVLRCHTLNCFGVGESDLEAMLPDLIRRGRRPTVGITVSQATISLRILADGADEAECQQQIQETTHAIHACLGNLVFGTGEEELQDVVVRELRSRRWTVASAELNSGGRLSQSLSAADPANEIYLGGFVVGRRPVTNLDETAELAQECRIVHGATVGIAMSRLPPVSAQSPPGEFHVVAAEAKRVASASFPFSGHPEILQPRAVKQALNFLRLHLQSLAK